MATFNETRTYGIEMEVITRRQPRTIANMINSVFHARGISNRAEAQGYNHSTQAIWKIVPDGSLDGRGWEVVSPPLAGVDGKNQLEAVCQALRSLDIRVDRSTGLHIHHDASDLTGTQIGRVVATYAAHQEVINMMLAPSRRQGAIYCNPINWGIFTVNGTDNFGRDSRSTIVSKWGRGTSGRYSAVNLYSLSQHGTIEFRQHQGTIDAEKIWNWILLTQSIVEASAEMTRLPKKATGTDSRRSPFSSFRRAIKISPTDNKNEGDWGFYMGAFRYWAKRLAYFCQSEGRNPNTLERV